MKVVADFGFWHDLLLQVYIFIIGRLSRQLDDVRSALLWFLPAHKMHQNAHFLDSFESSIFFILSDSKQKKAIENAVLDMTSYSKYIFFFIIKNFFGNLMMQGSLNFGFCQRIKMQQNAHFLDSIESSIFFLL